MKHCCWRFGEQGKDTDEGTSILLFIRIIRKLHSRRSFHLREEEQPGNYGTILKAWHLVAGIWLSWNPGLLLCSQHFYNPFNRDMSSEGTKHFTMKFLLFGFVRYRQSFNQLCKNISVFKRKNKNLKKTGFQKFGKPYSLHKPTQQCKRLTDAPALSANVHGLSLFLPHR